ncbi:MAG TPA: hypothetical protein VFZ27_14800 [Terriglobia bacterium]|nr:hypothetical protein [Terriglobia bacterium]
MKRRILTLLLAGPLFFGLPILHSLLGQACSEDEGMVQSYVQSIDDLVGTVKKESLSDFEKDYHQRSCLTRLTLSLGIIDGLIDCLSKTASNPAATQEQIAAAKGKLEKYSKLKSALEQARDTLKAAKDTKGAKSAIEKFTIAV